MSEKTDALWKDEFWTSVMAKVKPREGFSARYPGKIDVLCKYAEMLPEESVIAEIGFNVGHGAHALISSAKGLARFVSFDICEHQYAKPHWQHFQNNFSFFETVEGDTTETLKDFSTSNKDIFDLIHVDGGHKYEIALSDLRCSQKLVKSGGFIIVDDTNIKGVSRALSELDMNNFEVIEECDVRSGGKLSDIGTSRQSKSTVLRRKS